MELIDLVRALRRFWLIIAGLTAGAAVLAGVVTAAQPAEYTATAQAMVSVSNPQQRPPYALSSGAQYILDRMTSYAELGVTTPVLAAVVDDLNLEETPLSLSGRIESHSVVGKAIVEVSVTYNNPDVAAAIADRVVVEMGYSVAALEKGNIQLVAVGPALVPVEPSNGKVVTNTAVAAAGGLALGCLIAVMLQWASRRRMPSGEYRSAAPVSAKN